MLQREVTLPGSTLQILGRRSNMGSRGPLTNSREKLEHGTKFANTRYMNLVRTQCTWAATCTIRALTTWGSTRETAPQHSSTGDDVRRELARYRERTPLPNTSRTRTEAVGPAAHLGGWTGGTDSGCSRTMDTSPAAAVSTRSHHVRLGRQGDSDNARAQWNALG